MYSYKELFHKKEFCVIRVLQHMFVRSGNQYVTISIKYVLYKLIYDYFTLGASFCSKS